MPKYKFYGEIPTLKTILPVSKKEITIPATHVAFIVAADSLEEAKEQLEDDFFDVDFIREVE